MRKARTQEKKTNPSCFPAFLIRIDYPAGALTAGAEFQNFSSAETRTYYEGEPFGGLPAAKIPLACRLRKTLQSAIDSQTSPNNVLIILTTWPDAEIARAAARKVVEEKLAACANVVPGVESIYRWQGNIETSSEVLVIFKTTPARYAALEARIRELHSYEVPEILSLPIGSGLPAYLGWVEESCRD
ncbi:MAG TPA: divalent-cation tolerance protein CutA [Chthoniobacter sp.]|nr:divalent-cation tolerance protein CutA [Chthoniobacter sp.]